MRKSLIVLAFASALASPAALADENPQGPAAQANQSSAQQPVKDVSLEQGPLDEVVCEVREIPVTGTRISRKREVCRTRREWLQDRQNGQDTLKKVQEMGRTSNGIKGASGG